MPRQAFRSNGGPRLRVAFMPVDYKGRGALKTCHSEFRHASGTASSFSKAKNLGCISVKVLRLICM